MIPGGTLTTDKEVTRLIAVQTPLLASEMMTLTLIGVAMPALGGSIPWCAGRTAGLVSSCGINLKDFATLPLAEPVQAE
jgi:hypothetical protein